MKPPRTPNRRTWSGCHPANNGVYSHPARNRNDRSVLSKFNILNHIASDRLWRFGLIAATTVLLLVQLAWTGYASFGVSSQKRNSLRLGAAAVSKENLITLHQLDSATAITKAQLLAIRRDIMSHSSELLSRQYAPNELLFRLVVDGHPWWSAPGYYYFGKSIEMSPGIPAKSVGLANPLLLIVPEFTTLSAQGGLKWIRSESNDKKPLVSPDFPLYPNPGHLKFYPAGGRASVAYDLTAHLKKLRRWVSEIPQNLNFATETYNAFDLGFSYVYLSLENSINIANSRRPAAPVTTYSLFGYSPTACGNKEGCNHLQTRLVPYAEIKITALPARAVFKLWRDQPKDLETREDLLFTIDFL